MRTFFYFGLSTFVALYFVAELDASKAEANAALAVLLFAGALDAGRRPPRPLRPPGLPPGHNLGTRPAGLPVPRVGSARGHRGARADRRGHDLDLLLTTLMGQEYLPRRIGLASGVTLGLAIGLGGGRGAVRPPGRPCGRALDARNRSLLPSWRSRSCSPPRTRAEARERAAAEARRRMKRSRLVGTARGEPKRP